MHVREKRRFEPWPEYDNPWLRYESRKAELREVYLEQRATGTDGGAAGWRTLSAGEYQDAILGLCEELDL